MIGIIDYGAGNLQSVYKAVKHIGAECKIVADTDELLKCDGAILPGVGSFADAMDCMEKSHLVEAVKEYALGDKPFWEYAWDYSFCFPKARKAPEPRDLHCLRAASEKSRTAQEN